MFSHYDTEAHFYLANTRRGAIMLSFHKLRRLRRNMKNRDLLVDTKGLARDVNVFISHDSSERMGVLIS